jgi:hypothetical protein
MKPKNEFFPQDTNARCGSLYTDSPPLIAGKAAKKRGKTATKLSEILMPQNTAYIILGAREITVGFISRRAFLSVIFSLCHMLSP